MLLDSALGFKAQVSAKHESETSRVFLLNPRSLGLTGAKPLFFEVVGHGRLHLGFGSSKVKVTSSGLG